MCARHDLSALQLFVSLVANPGSGHCWWRVLDLKREGAPGSGGNLGYGPIGPTRLCHHRLRLAGSLSALSLRAVCQGRFARRMTSNNMASNTSTKNGFSQVFSSNSCVALPPSLGNPESSKPTDGHLDGSLAKNLARHGNGKEFHKGGDICTYAFLPNGLRRL